MKNRDATFKAQVAQIGIECRQALGEEQSLVNDRPARQRANVKTLNLRRDHPLFDPPTDEIEVFLKLGDARLIGHWSGDHDLFDFRPRRLRLLADHRHIDGHLTPTINGIAFLDDRRFNDGAARLLRRQIGAGQENHPDTQPIGQRAMTR